MRARQDAEFASGVSVQGCFLTEQTSPTMFSPAQAKQLPFEYREIFS